MHSFHALFPELFLHLSIRRRLWLYGSCLSLLADLAMWIFCVKRSLIWSKTKRTSWNLVVCSRLKVFARPNAWTRSFEKSCAPRATHSAQCGKQLRILFWTVFLYPKVSAPSPI